MTSVLIGAVLLGLAAPGGGETPTLSLITIKEERYKAAGKGPGYGYSTRMHAGVRIEGWKDVRSWGNVKVTEAKTDGGKDLICRRTDPGWVYGLSDAPGFKAVADYEAKSRTIDFPVTLHFAPRSAKTFTLKGTIDVLVGGKQTDVDFPDVLARKAGEELKDEALTAAGLKILMGGWDAKSNKLRYAIEGNNSIVKLTELVDAGGKVIKTFHGWSPSPRGGETHYRTGMPKIPKDARLRVTIYKGAKIKTLPFAFAGVELP
jgi:hypothetical protein